MSSITNSSSWIFVLEENKLTEGGVNIVSAKGLSILLIKEDGEIYAVSNRCAHMGCALGGGSLKDRTIQCPCHDWRFDLRTGEFLNAREIKIPVYPWRIVEGKIFINIEEGGHL